MPHFNNALEIFMLLNKSNCRECGEKTCLAFAGAVFTGKKNLIECNVLDKNIIEQFRSTTRRPNAAEADFEKMVGELKRKIVTMNLPTVAERLGAKFSDDKLTVKILGKNFSVDSNGNLSSDIHIHSWITVPFLNYIIGGKGSPASGEWVPLRELKNGKTWYRLFGQMCEKRLKKVADTYTDLFEDMVHLFKGRPVENHYESDISLVLHPLPQLPILICYWKPEDRFESDLHVFFDSDAEDNLNIESIYTLGVGLALMFEKIASRHGF